MNLYNKKFLTVLEAGEKTANSPVSDQQAFQQKLDPGTATTAYDTNAVAAYKDQVASQQINTLQQWIAQVAEFVTYLNGVDDSSVQAVLNNAECETLFADIAKSETKRIARIAQELSGFNESLKGYVLRSKE